ncbi:MAG: hypothetical protein IJF27_05165 [Oscillospiraceae bacterium]|nr:hypothetical protein [Oscillospiraceae bacterium]
MTIAEIAASLGVSKQAVYQKIKRAGLSVNTLKDHNTGEFTDEGAQTIVNLFNNTPRPNIDVSTPSVEQVETINALNNDIDRLNIEVDRLNDLVEQLTNERDFLREALLQAQKSADQAQQLQAMTLTKLLPAPRPGIAERLRQMFKKGAAIKTSDN